MKSIVTYLDIIERQAHNLKEQVRKGGTPEWRNVKVIIKALGAIAEDPQFQAEAAKKGSWIPYVLNMLAGVVRSL